MAAIWPASGQGSGSESMFHETEIIHWPIGEHILTSRPQTGARPLDGQA